MPDFSKVLWVKFGWSEWYRGEQVYGNFRWLKAQKGKETEGRGHEAFNFLPDSNGVYHCYVPPQGKGYAPSNDDPDGWTVICLAKNPKHKGIHIVGWYEDAKLHGGWFRPPELTDDIQESPAEPADAWSYCITSRTAYFIPPAERNAPFSDPSIQQGKYSFLKDPAGIKDPKGNKQRVFKLLKRRLAELALVAIKNPTTNNPPDPELDAADPMKGFGTPAQRKMVEQAAEKAVIKYYESKGYSHRRVTDLPCGHDFRFTKGKTTLNVEVKGTSSPNPQFYLTRNEHDKGLMSDQFWRLAMVTNALSDELRRVTIYSSEELDKVFDLEPYVYIGKFIPVVTG